MNNKLVVAPTKTSLLCLNYYCLLDIFEFLKLEDLINLAESCSHLKVVIERIFKKCLEFEFNAWMINKPRTIDHILSYIGQYVISLKFICSKESWNLSKIISKACNEQCKNLTCIKIYNWGTDPSLDISSEYSFDSVNMLILYNCDLTFKMCFFKNFHKLKFMNVYNLYHRNSTDPKKLRIILERNSNINSFVYREITLHKRYDLDCKLLKLIPNVERLSLFVNGSNILEVETLLELDKLTKLRLHCDDMNINEFLRKLAEKGIIKELQLSRIYIDCEFLDILQSLNTLELLVIVSSVRVETISSLAWPTELKRLRLAWFNFSHNDFIALIRDLKCLEMLDLRDCDIMKGDKSCFNDVANLSQEILHAVDHRNRRQRLNIILPDCVKPVIEDRSNKFIVNSHWLRIHWPDKNDQLGIKIHFPGCDFS